MLIGGGFSNVGQALASVLVLAADGSGWSDLAPLTGVRIGAAAALLPGGKVLVAGGKSGTAADAALNTAELWDPATQKWTALPPMTHKRHCTSTACVLPSGRVAVVGGYGADGAARKDGEVFDPEKREWELLGAEMARPHANISAVAVCSGLVVAGGNKLPELFEEESGRWVALPHAMAEPRQGTGLISLPAAALVALR
jgi:hypothetical protein